MSFFSTRSLRPLLACLLCLSVAWMPPTQAQVGAPAQPADDDASVLVLGEISTETYVDFQNVVRDTVKDIGYTRADYGFDYLTCGTLVSVKEQSADIAQGVDEALEVRDDKAPHQELGAGDQTGFDVKAGQAGMSAGHWSSRSRARFGHNCGAAPPH